MSLKSCMAKIGGIDVDDISRLQELSAERQANGETEARSDTLAAQDLLKELITYRNDLQSKVKARGAVPDLLTKKDTTGTSRRKSDVKRRRNEFQILRSNGAGWSSKSKAVFQGNAWGLEQTHYPVRLGYSGNKMWALQRRPDLTELDDADNFEWPWTESMTPDGAFTYVKVPDIYIDDIKSLTGSIIMKANTAIVFEGVDSGNIGGLNPGDEVIKYDGSANNFFAAMDEFVKPVGDRLLDANAAFPDIYYRPEEINTATLDNPPINPNIDSVEQDLFADTEVQDDELRDDNQRDDTRVSAPGGVQADGVERGAGQDPGAVPGEDRTVEDASSDGSEAIQPGFDWDSPSPAAGVNGSVSSRDISTRDPGRSGRTVSSNYRIRASDQLGLGSPLEKARGNLEAVRIVKSLKAENRKATADEQAQLVKYVGWGDGQLVNNIFPSKREPTGSWVEIHDELKTLLTSAEYDSARRSTRYAHYTSKSVIDSMYTALTGFGLENGAAIEGGMGTGNFVGLIPDSMHLLHTGVEFDGITADIAKALYPESGTIHGDFTKISLPQNHYDLAIGNPPFSGDSITSDPKYRKYKFVMHDYFIAKQLDSVRPGGIAAFVTSKGTMDKVDNKFRAYVMERAVFLGAMRLPNSAFKETAGTEVVTDVLFFQKRPEQIRLTDTEEYPVGIDADTGETIYDQRRLWETETAWLRSVAVDIDGTEKRINTYFASNPHMVLGKQTLTGTMYATDEYTVEPTGDIVEMMAEAVGRLPKDIIENPTIAELDANADKFALDPEGKEGIYYLDSKNRLREIADGVGEIVPVRGKGVSKGFNKNQEVVIRSYIELRDKVLAVYRAQTESPAVLEAAQKAMESQYHRFVRKHGILNETKVNERQVKATPKKEAHIQTFESYPVLDVVQNDPYAFVIANIESYNPNDNTAELGRIFSERLEEPTSQISIASAQDALAVTLNEKGYVDMDRLVELYGIPEDEAVSELGTAIFKDPVTDAWVTDDEYLSGNVKAKLAVALDEVEDSPEFADNVEALKAVIPEDLPISKIPLRLGPIWMPADMIQRFAEATIGFNGNITSIINADTSSWIVDSKRNHTELKFDSSRRTGVEILDAALNQVTIRISDKVSNGQGGFTSVLNKKATIAANQKVQEIREAFERWVLNDGQATDTISTIYNRDFNTNVPRKFNGDHLTLPRLNKMKYKLHQWQKDVVWRALQTGNTYIAHDVGAGKTLSAAIIAMESKRLGLANKPMIGVLKPTLRQFMLEFLDAYPDANLLVADENMLDKKNVRKFFARVMADEWDAIIITHEALNKLPMSDEFITEHIGAEIAVYRALLEDIDTSDRHTRREIEAQIENFEDKLNKLTDQKRKIVGVDFEDTGIDLMILDEAHKFKKIPFATRQGSTKGVDAKGSGRGMDVYLKTQYLNTIKPGKGVILMSGTPITNTMGELFNIQRYLQPQVLQAKGLSSFDSWSATFAESVTELEMGADGSYKTVTRLSRFIGVQALMRDFLTVADIVTTNDLKSSTTMKLPKVQGGGRQIRTAPMAPEQKDYQVLTTARLKAIENRTGKVEKGDDIILSVITDARKAAMDMRLLGLEQSTPSKLDLMIDDVHETWLETRDQEYYSDTKKSRKEPITGSTQLIFSEWVGTEFFNIHQHIKDVLIARGVPATEIVSIQDYKSTKKKKKLFREVNSGQVRIVIGASDNLGTGTNVQQRLIAINHLDISYVPSDTIQREGRGVRQGNKNDEITLRAYATEGTIDATMWQFSERKQRTINQVMSGDLSVDSVEDIGDNVSQMAQAKAIASGNPLLLEQAGLDAEVTKLRALRDSNSDMQQRYRRDIKAYESYLPGLKQSQTELKELSKSYVPTQGDAFSLSVNGKEFVDRKKAGNYLAAFNATGGADAVVVGKLGGLDLYQSQSFGGIEYGFYENAEIQTPTQGTYSLSRNLNDAKDTVGFIRQLENLANKTAGLHKSLGVAVLETEAKLKMMKDQLGTEFQYYEDLATKEARLDEINQELAPPPEEEKADDVDETDGDVAFHLNVGSPTGKIMKASVVREAIADTISSWQSGPMVRVVQMVIDLPPGLREKAMGQDKTVSGAVDPDTGDVYLVANNIRDPEDALTILAHEAVAHVAFEREFSEQLESIYEEVDFLADADANVRAIADEVAESYAGESRGRQAAEVIARLEEQRIPHTIWSRLRAAVRDFLRRIGFTINLNRADIDDMLRRANNSLRQPSNRARPLRQDPSFSVTGNAIDDARPAETFFVDDERRRDVFVRKLQDKFQQLFRTQEAIKKHAGIEELPEVMDPYLAETLSYGRTEEEMKKFKKRLVGPFVKELSTSDVTQEALDLYVIAKHAKDRNEHIKQIDPSREAGSGMSDAEADVILRAFAREGKLKQAETLAKHLYGMNKERMRIILKSGLETPATIMGWMEEFGPYYVPLKGSSAGTGRSGMLRTGQGFAVRGKESMHAMGRRTMAESPVLHTIAQFEETLVRREKSIVGRALKKLVEKYPNKDYWEIYDAKNMPTRRWLNPKTMEVMFIPDSAMYNDKDYFPVKENGKQYFIHLKEPLMAAAMHNMGPDRLNVFMKNMNGMQRYFAAVNTALSPGFVLVNMVRDLQTAIFNIVAEQDLKGGRIKGKKIGKQVLRDYGKALAAAYRGLRGNPDMSNEWDRWFQEYKESGAKIGFFGLQSPDQIQREIASKLRRAQDTHNPLDALLAIKDWIYDVNGAAENAIRFSTYVNSRRAGLTPARAGDLSKNLTVNFNRKGELGVWANTFWLFFNASVQGIAQFHRVMQSKTARKLAGGMMVFAAVLAELNRFLSDDDDDGVSFYDKIPDYVKERNIILMNPWSEKKGDFFSYPLPYGYNIFHVMGTVTNEVAHGIRSPQSGAGMMARTAMGSFNPLGFQESDSFINSVIKTMTPTIGQPVIQLALNETFYGGPIYRENFPVGTPRPDSALGKDSTADHFKAIVTFMNANTRGSDFRSGVIDIHPEALEHLYQFATGSAGAFLERSVKLVEKLATGSEVVARDIPIARRFYGQSYDYEDTGQFYDRFDELMQVQEEFDALRDGKNRFETGKFRRKYRTQLSLVDKAKKTNSELRSLWSDRREADDKGRPTTNIVRKINRKIDEFNKAYNQRMN